jgi:hypothetical protein
LYAAFCVCGFRRRRRRRVCCRCISDLRFLQTIATCSSSAAALIKGGLGKLKARASDFH